MKTLSIIIPAFNMQDYLRKCLDSLIGSQCLQELDILVVNDGSTDVTSLIAHEYESEYPGIIRVIDKENGHYGSCVNRGLLEAKGKYIKILDADDWFDADSLDQYLNYLSDDNESDLVITDYREVDNDGSLLKKIEFNFPRNKHFLFNTLECDRGIFFIHGMTYRTAFLREIGYRQTEGICYSDSEWSYLPLLFVNVCTYYPIIFYNYRIGREGQSVDPKIFIKNIDDHIKVSKSIIDYYDNVSSETINENAKLIADDLVRSFCCKIYRIYLIEHNRTEYHANVLKEFDSYLKRYRPKIYHMMYRLKTKGFPFYYVWFWRAAGFRLPVSFVRDFVRMIRYGQK